MGVVFFFFGMGHLLEAAGVVEDLAVGRPESALTEVASPAPIDIALHGAPAHDDILIMPLGISTATQFKACCRS